MTTTPDITTVTARRQLLLDELERVGPEHFDQMSWGFDAQLTADAPGIHSLDLVNGERVAHINRYDFTHCGSAACLAGHGASVMARVGGFDPDIVIDQEVVADWFGLPTSWFDEDLDGDHLGANEYPEAFDDEGFRDYNEVNDWHLQRAGLRILIEQGISADEAARHRA